jgi:hypothetical protein
MTNHFLSFIISITTFFSFAQQKELSGLILDRVNKPIAYANIGIVNKPLGTVSSLEGKFKLTISNDQKNDTIRISCLGYKSRDFIVKDLIENNINIKLETYVENLQEVVIFSSKLSIRTDGKLRTNAKNKCIFANPDFKNLNLGSEIGRKFKLGSKKPSILSEFKFYIKENNFDYVKFRINIYSVLNNKPNKKINTENIFVTVSKNYTDWVEVDLSAFEIAIQEDIIIAVEWIEHSKNGNKLNLPIIVPSLGSTHFYKFGTQNSWQRYSNLSTPMFLTYKQ